MGTDPLIGLVINPGPWNVVLPSTAELHALGPNWVRYLCTFPFQDLQTGQNTELDLVINQYRELGVHVLVLINNESLEENPPEPGSLLWGDANSGFIGRVSDLAQKIASFYRNQLDAIEIFNEPDTMEISPEDYAQLLVACYQKIKAVSTVSVISAGICCGRNHPYLRSIVQSAPNAFDGVGWHPYGLSVEGYPASAWGFGDLRDSIVRARAIAGKPLWVTEIGATLEYNWPTGLTPEGAAAEYLHRAFGLFHELGAETVAHAFWYTWKDMGGGWGLVDTAGIRRPSWYAFQRRAHPAPPEITEVVITPTVLESGALLNIRITVLNNSADTLTTQGPEPGFVYEEGESFEFYGFGPLQEAFRVGIDFDERAGIDHPYRWGLGAPLAPGASTTITGAVKLRAAQVQNYWAGLVQEKVAWVQDRQGIQNVTVTEPGKTDPEITGVEISPATLMPEQLLTIKITVKNNTGAPLATQGPEPDTIYEEGDTFYTHGFPAIPGTFRVGIDFEGRNGIDHPYRWGLGAPLAPGESRVIAGAIRLHQPQVRSYWVGLVKEQIAWLEDHTGTRRVQVIPTETRPRVIHIHGPNATTWNGQPDYWAYVNQDVVDRMVEHGMIALTGRSTLADAWTCLLPQYRPGQGIAIKVNFANDGNGQLDASIQTLNAIVRGLVQIGVVESDVWIYDAVQSIPDRFIAACRYPGVKFYDNGAHARAGFDNPSPEATITFVPPPGVPGPGPIKINDVLVGATYLINVPIFKGHLSGAGVTLGFKNHLGSTNYPLGFHPHIFPAEPTFRTDYNALVDLYGNPNIRKKTVLVIGDGLFTGDDWGSAPMVMARFGNRTPNSLFLGTDPVALDCVMYDLLDAEWQIDPRAAEYLRLAGDAGLGVFERGDPWGGGYTRIDYRKIEE